MSKKAFSEIFQRWVARGRRSPVAAAANRARLRMEEVEQRLAPATAVWSGDAIPPNNGNTPNWSASRNWQGNYIPRAGDDVIFPAGLDNAHRPPAVVVNGIVFFPVNPSNAWLLPANSIIDPNYAAINPTLTLGNIVIRDDNYHIDGFGIGTVTILGDITYSGTDTLNSLDGLSLIGPFAPSEPSALNIRLGGGGQQQRFNVVNANTALAISAPISGNLGILKVGQGILGLAGDNTFTGAVEVSQGILAVRDQTFLTPATPLGTGPAGTVVRIGASLAISGGANVDESLEIVGDGFGGVGALVAQSDPIMIFTGGLSPFGNDTSGTWSGGIALTPSASIGGPGTLTISRSGGVTPVRSISGGGDLTKVGGGTVILNNENTYSGQTLINRGTLTIRHNLALSIGSSTTVSTGARLVLGASLQVGTEEVLNLNGNGFNDLANNPMGALQQVGAFNASTWLTPIALLTDASIGTDLFTTLTLTGELLSTGPSLSKVGQGTLVIPVDNPNFAGNTFVNNGVLRMTTAQALGPTTAAGGPTPGGSITVNSTPTASGSLQVEGPFDMQKDLTLNGIGYNSGGALRILGTITWANPIALGSPTSIFTSAGATLTTNAPISGLPDAVLEKNGPGTLILPVANEYLGATTLREGLTVILDNTSLGGAGGEGTRIVDGATLRLDAALTIRDENLTLSGNGLGGIGALQAGTGANTWTGLVTLISEPGGTPVVGIDVENAALLTFTNVVSGNSDLRKIGTGTLRLAGTEANTYTGTTFVNDGILALAKSAGVNALSGPTVVGDGVGGSNTAVLRLEAANQIPNVQPVRVNTDGLFDLSYFDETINTLTLQSGGVANGTAVGGNSNSTFGGRIIGDGPLTKVGTGTFTLTVDSPLYTGTMTVVNGTLLVNANHGNAAVVVQNGGTLGGTGRVGNVTVNLGGILAPGTGPGILTAGNVTFAANSSFVAEANGPAAGTGYDQLVAGAVALNNATLVFNPSSSFAPALNSSFTIINATSLSGTFAGLPDMATFTAGPRVYQINYTATSDVVITVVKVAANASLTSTPNPSLPGQIVRFTATFAPGVSGDPTPTGTVEFFDGSTSLGTRTLDNNGVATLDAALSTAGPHTIRADYSGDASYVASATPLLTQSVTVISTTSLQALQGSILVGTSAGFVARVAQAANLPVPTGAVTFIDQGSGATLGVVALDGSGAASLTTTALPAGTRTVLAAYSGDDFYRSSSATVTQVVNERVQSLVVTAPPGPFVIGSTVTVTATALDALGNVANFNDPLVVTVTPNNGAAVVTPVTPVFVNGRATFTVTLNAAAFYTIGVASAGLSASSGPIEILYALPQTDKLSGVFAAATDKSVRDEFGNIIQEGSPFVTVYGTNGQPLTTLLPFPPGFSSEVDAGSPGFTGGIRLSVADVTGDGIADYVVGSGPTITATVQVIDGSTNRTILTLRPFETFQGGVFVSTGDLTGDGIADIVITPDQGGGPRVTIIAGGTFRQVANFIGIDDPNFRGGARAAMGDVNGDGFADLVVSAGFGGGPRISIYDGAALNQGVRLNVIGDFFLFEPALRNGAYVAVGDVNGDGLADLIGGAGPGGGPRVLILDSATLLQRGSGAALATPLFNDFLGDINNRGGVRVAAKNLNNDRFTDLLVGAGEGGGSRVEAYSGNGFGLLQSFDLLPGFTGGVFVG